MYMKPGFVHFELDYTGDVGSSQMDSVGLGGGKLEEGDRIEMVSE